MIGVETMTRNSQPFCISSGTTTVIFPDNPSFHSLSMVNTASSDLKPLTGAIVGQGTSLGHMNTALVHGTTSFSFCLVAVKSINVTDPSTSALL